MNSAENEGETPRRSGRFLREVEIGFKCGDALTKQIIDELNTACEDYGAEVAQRGRDYAVLRPAACMLIVSALLIALRTTSSRLRPPAGQVLLAAPGALRGW